MKEDFEEAKKKAVRLGYIEIDPITGRKWFDWEFEKMNALHYELSKLYPTEYKTWDEEKRKKFKEDLAIKHPNLGQQWSDYFSWKGKLERNALNYRVQGLSGSMTKYAAVLFREYQIKNNNFNDYYLINLVHDEILVECTKDSKLIAEVVKECMEKGGEIMCKKVKMGATPVIAKVWGH